MKKGKREEKRETFYPIFFAPELIVGNNNKNACRKTKKSLSCVGGKLFVLYHVGAPITEISNLSYVLEIQTPKVQGTPILAVSSKRLSSSLILF